jgi:hypothetical protein
MLVPITVMRYSADGDVLAHYNVDVEMQAAVGPEALDMLVGSVPVLEACVADSADGGPVGDARAVVETTAHGINIPSAQVPTSLVDMLGSCVVSVRFVSADWLGTRRRRSSP